MFFWNNLSQIHFRHRITHSLINGTGLSQNICLLPHRNDCWNSVLLRQNINVTLAYPKFPHWKLFILCNWKYKYVEIIPLIDTEMQGTLLLNLSLQSNLGFCFYLNQSFTPWVQGVCITEQGILSKLDPQPKRVDLFETKRLEWGPSSIVQSLPCL